MIGGDFILQKLSLRGHKFMIQWDLFLHLSIITMALVPFTLTGKRVYSLIPLLVWACYNILFLIGSRRSNQIVPGFGKFRLFFQASIEEFLSPKYLYIIYHLFYNYMILICPIILCV
jgi:hypothetical protein